jgi:hypothetical protein
MCTRSEAERVGVHLDRLDRRSHRVRIALLLVFAALVGAGAASGTASSVRGSGVVNGDNHHSGAFKTGRFSLGVSGRTGWIRYVNRAQHVRFASTRIRLFRDETTSYRTVAIAGIGKLNGRRVRFYVRCIDAGGPLEDVFYVNFREPGGFWLSEAGGRIWSGDVAVR